MFMEMDVMRRTVRILVAGALLAGAAWGESVSEKVTKAMSAMGVEDYDTFIKHATGLLAMYPMFERRGEMGLQVVKAMMYTGRWDDARAYAEKLLVSDPFNPMVSELRRELALLGEVETLPSELVKSYLEADRRVVQRRLQSAIDRYWEIAEDERLEGTELRRRARYEAARMEYTLLDREFPKDQDIPAEDLISLWRGYLAEAEDAGDEEEIYLGAVRLMRAYTRYAVHRREGESEVPRPDFIRKGLEVAVAYRDRFEDKDKRTNVRYRHALLLKELGFFYIPIDTGKTIEFYAQAVGEIKELIEGYPEWHLKTQALRNASEMEVPMGMFDKVYKDAQQWIKDYPRDIEIAKAIEYLAVYAQNERQVDYAFCADQLIWKNFPHTDLAQKALNRYLPLLAAHNRNDITISLCDILYRPEVDEGPGGPESPNAVEAAPVDPIAATKREEREERNRKIWVVVGLTVAAAVLFLITKRRI